MFEDFQHKYCPHCDARLENIQGNYPDICPVCGRIIWYTKVGTYKGLFKLPSIPILILDIFIVILLVLAVIYRF